MLLIACTLLARISFEPSVIHAASETFGRTCFKDIIGEYQRTYCCAKVPTARHDGLIYSALKKLRVGLGFGSGNADTPLFLVDRLPACSYFVLMESSGQKRRFPPPWTVEVSKDQYRVKDANGITLACIYSRDDLHAAQWDYYQAHLTSDEARRIAKAIARIPDFLRTYSGFDKRQVQRVGRYWKSSHPYHVALQNSYVQENYDEIVACCRYNSVPCEATGEWIMRGHIRYCVYEFERQFDAIRFWDKFSGKWIVGDDFIEVEPPRDFTPMKSFKRKGAI